MTNSPSDTRVPVWDPLVRFGHWALVAAFTVAYLTGEEEREPSEWHEWAGYIAGAIVIWRVLWGLAGPKYARFGHFAVWPRTALFYLIDLIAGRSKRYIGHSPAGGVMIFTLLAFICATVITGLLAGQGGSAARPQQGAVATAHSQADEAGKAIRGGHRGHHDGEVNPIGGVHDALANITFLLVILHILGVALASFVHRENLVAAMITGKKRPENSPE